MKERFDPSGKLALHSQFVNYLRHGHIYPVNVEISPCGWCNATCDFCWYAQGELGGHRKVMLQPERLSTLLDECAAIRVKSITWTGGGDPSLHPDIGIAVHKAEMVGLGQGMFTNALAPPRYDPGRMEWIRITMTDRPFKPDCIKPLRAAKTLGFAFNWHGDQDTNYLWETVRLAESVKADYVQIRPALAFHGATVDIKPPTYLEHPLIQVTGYKFEDAKKPHGYATCEGYHFVPFIWEDGNVDVCAYMRKHDGYTLGNIYNEPFKSILDRAPESVLVHPNCQVCCKNHEINKAIHHARALEDINFP